MPGGEVDNFLIPCFCRMLFKEKHPTSSGRHYFFLMLGSVPLFFLFCVPQIFLTMLFSINSVCMLFLFLFLKNSFLCAGSYYEVQYCSKRGTYEDIVPMCS
jgi:hypothetical protein